jgi:hypothetical protein
MNVNYVLVMGIMLITAATADAAVLDFEDISLGGATAIFINPVDSGGFRFSGPSNFGVENNSEGASNDSNHLFAQDSASMVQLNSDAFNLLSFDFGEDFFEPGLFDYYPTTLEVRGYTAGGGVVSISFEVDGLFDGSGGFPDFQSVSLTGFSNLQSVEFIGSGGSLGNTFVLDNIQVSPIPEPASIGLLGLVAGGLYFSRRFFPAV